MQEICRHESAWYSPAARLSKAKRPIAGCPELAKMTDFFVVFRHYASPKKHCKATMSPIDSAINPTEAAYDLYPEIRAMFDEFPRYRKEVLPSKYWEQLNRKNLQQLADSKYENFKRTLARNYFTWIINPFDEQLRFLMREAGIWPSIGILVNALLAPRHEHLKKKHTIFYNTLANLLWSYVEKNDTDDLLGRLSEPREGNPPEVMRNGRLISQDLANSLLEYEAILHPDLDRRDVRTILELGPGYGRTAYVFIFATAGG